MNLRESWSLMKGGGGTGGRMASSKQTNRTWLLALFFMACSFFPVILSSDLPAGVLELKPLTVSMNKPVNIALKVKDPNTLKFVFKAPIHFHTCLRDAGDHDKINFVLGDHGCEFSAYWYGIKDDDFGYPIFTLDKKIWSGVYIRYHYARCTVFSPGVMRECGNDKSFASPDSCVINPAGGKMNLEIKQVYPELRCNVTMEIHGDVKLADYVPTTLPPPTTAAPTTVEVETEEPEEVITSVAELPTDGANKISCNFKVVWMFLTGAIGLIFPWVLYG